MKGKKGIIIGLIVVFIIAILLSLLFYVGSTFKINGEPSMTISYNTEYVDKGATFKNMFGDFTKKIKTYNYVKTNKIGDYKVDYYAKFIGIKMHKSRAVSVVDTNGPVITFLGGDLLKVCPNKTYTSDDFTAIDDVDGDLTDNVKVHKEEDKMVYTVSDKSGNVTEIHRDYFLGDNEKPVIELKGESLITLNVGEKYFEQGYTVTDNCYDLRDKVVVTDNIDNTKAGSYAVTYAATDDAGNTTIIERTVNIAPVPVEKKENPATPGVIYFTFDDGPSGSGSTAKILDTLKKYNIKATFFITGSGPDELIKREYEEGHKIAAHTYTHDYSKVYSSVEGYFKDLDLVNARIKKITGTETNIIRFPGGSNNTVSNKYSKGIMNTLTKEVTERGYIYFDWNVDASDAFNCAKSSVKDKETCVYKNVIGGLSKKKTNVVLMHDIKGYSANVLEKIIQYALENGYSFQTISENTKQIKFK